MKPPQKLRRQKSKRTTIDEMARRQ